MKTVKEIDTVLSLLWDNIASVTACENMLTVTIDDKYIYSDIVINMLCLILKHWQGEAIASHSVTSYGFVILLEKEHTFKIN